MNIESNLNSFVNEVNLRHKNLFDKNYPNLDIPVASVNKGRKYFKIIISNSVHSFIDKTSGDIFKAASFNAPAKHARGNIFSNTLGYEALDQYGMVIYL